MSGSELKPNTTEYKRAFNKEKYDQFLISVPKGEKEVLKEFAKSKGKSLNAFIVEAIKEKMEREK
jgi:predicted HicB family RNase H-like nuclease